MCDPPQPQPIQDKFPPNQLEERFSSIEQEMDYTVEKTPQIQLNDDTSEALQTPNQETTQPWLEEPSTIEKQIEMLFERVCLPPKIQYFSLFFLTHRL